MISIRDAVKIVLKKLTELSESGHWGEVTFRVSLKGGDLQELTVTTDTRYRSPPPSTGET